MRRSASKSRGRRPTAVVLGLLILFVVATVGFLGFGVGSDDDKDVVKARSPSSTADPNVPTVATLATTSTTRRPETEYAVKAGDTLTSIAAQFRTSTVVILDANDIPNPDNLVVGQVLVIPASPKIRLVITPKKVHPGEAVTLEFRGAQPEESIRFEIVGPGGTFTGPSHDASKGRVTTSYQPARDALPGVYVVTAKGDRFTTVQATFRVLAAVP